MASRASSEERTAQDRQARAELARLAHGQLAVQIVGAAARLGILDLIGDAERTAPDIAHALGTHPQATHRLLRALAGLRFLTETQPATFAATPKGALLRSDVPGTMHSMFCLVTNPALVRGWAHVEESVRTGETSFDKVYGTDIFTYLKAHPELSEEYNAAMSGASQGAAGDVPAHYDFGRFGTVVDMGGGDGSLLSAIVRRHPAPRGILFDSPEGLAQAPARLAREGLTGRCRTQPGDFFAAAPPGGDLYVLKSVLHDWSDERCTRILRNIRHVVPDSGRLLIVEPVLPPTVTADAEEDVYVGDINMLLTYGGRERTRADFEALCSDAGFALSGVTPLPRPNPFHLIEATPVQRPA